MSDRTGTADAVAKNGEGNFEQGTIAHEGKKYRKVELPRISDFYLERDIRAEELRSRIYSLEYLRIAKKRHTETTMIFIALLNRRMLFGPEVFAGEEKLLANMFSIGFGRQKKTRSNTGKARPNNKYKHLEDSSHGISIREIIVPDWHPQKNFPPRELGFAIKCLQQGYKFMVNVMKGSAELVDDVSFLLAAKEMGIIFPPLNITRISFVDVSMYQCYLFLRKEISEWQKYLLVKSMLEHSKIRAVTKMLEMSERQLESFLRHGQEIENMNMDVNFFKKLVKKKIKLKDVVT